MATLADLMSVPSTITHKGKEYHIGPPGILEQGQFQRFLETRAREAIERGTYVNESARENDFNRLNRDIAAGVYEWEGEVCVEALQHRSGLQRYLEIITKAPAKEISELIDERLRIITQLVRSAQANDPKGVRAALTVLGLPANFLNEKKPLSNGSARRAKSRKRKSKR